MQMAGAMRQRIAGLGIGDWLLWHDRAKLAVPILPRESPDSDAVHKYRRQNNLTGAEYHVWIGPAAKCSQMKVSNAGP
jgi:hypothetical protein